jgi:hypothetical protein
MAAARDNFTPFVVRVPMNDVRALWLHFGTVRYGFPVSWFLNNLRARFVPVRFRRRRYGTVHPSIGGCTRTTPVPPNPYRGARAGPLTPIENQGCSWSRGSTGYTIGAGPAVAGACQ